VNEADARVGNGANWRHKSLKAERKGSGEGVKEEDSLNGNSTVNY
jgi:hypothetical protein